MRRFIFWIVSIFYPHIEIKGAEKLPQAGGYIVISNHPNGILDPVPMMIQIGRPISFLAKSTLWGIPLINVFVKLFDAIPIYRHNDDGKWFGPKGDTTERNEASFKQASQHLRNGGILALFPEGTTHSNPQLLPLKTGAARIALLNEEACGWTGEIPIVPIGLWYEHKSRFRSSVLIVVGDPFTLEQYEPNYLRDERETVRLLTEKLDEKLDEVVLQAESQEILRALPVITRWFNQELDSLSSQHAQMESMLRAYTNLKQKDPNRLDNIVQALRNYDQTVRSLGKIDPWQPEIPSISWGQLVTRLFVLILITPLAALGLLITYLPYRLAGFIAKHAIMGDDTQLSLAKIVGSALFLIITWLTLSIWAFNQLGLTYGLVLFFIIPLLAFSTLFWFERIQSVAKQLSQMRWLGARADVQAYINNQRSQLAELIKNAVQEYA
ncbi:MAG: lysophospholipid acyltransferase family protein [Chloroflexota bacterium]